MSRKEPLLGALKACILNIQADKDPITDGHPQLTSLCDILEIILRKGIRQPVLGLWRRDYWHWMEQLPQQDTCSRLPQLSMALEKTLACKRTLTAQGRGRYYIRQAMNRKIMAVTIHHLLHTPRLLEWYDRESSVLTNECFAEPFLSLLLVLSQMKFTLDLENSSFLDESWLLPVCEMYNTVPCRELGMVLWYTGGRIFVTEVIAGSQAEADECVQAGDIIDEINGVALRNAKGGEYGGKEVLDEGIEKVLQQNLVPQEVLLDVKETEVISMENSTQVLFHHHYPEIASVGQRLDRRALFAYCVAVSPETPRTTSFDCLVFESSSVKDATEIVSRIAAGFRNTEWFV
ncbi:uncharacterized protein si:ch211-250n8.1 isoform X2 [Leucoraja erinacea]|uniref:uncharacterized protein si:ch211-250n8.1 isoform X2 n=1 Tax=Leucoraja erinaceus TaxID=7782 RepID=UPI002453E53A|nr:uncharacterized protein si:ch211-250n8.1 isoform X2 [Leucoraja erinacea]